MFKLLKQNKMLVISFISLIFALFAIIIVGYAWFTENNKGKLGGLIGTVGTLGSSYQFGQVLGTGVDTEEKVQMDNVMPGSSYVFVVSVTNDSLKYGLVGINLYGIKSLIDTGNGYRDDYIGREGAKIQYAYKYEVLEIYYFSGIGGVNMIDSEGIDQANPLPSDEFLEEHGWDAVGDDKANYCPADALDGGQYFNQRQDDEDQKDYYLVKDLPISPKEEEKSGFIIYFRVSFGDTPRIPVGLEVPSDLMYENQQMHIENIIIISDIDTSKE